LVDFGESRAPKDHGTPQRRVQGIVVEIIGYHDRRGTERQTEKKKQTRSKKSPKE